MESIPSRRFLYRTKSAYHPFVKMDSFIHFSGKKKGVRDMKYTMAVTLDDIVYELYVMAVFCIEGSELSVPHRENFNFNCVLSLTPFFFPEK